MYLGNAKIPCEAISGIGRDSKIPFKIQWKGTMREFEMTLSQLEESTIPSLLIDIESLNGAKILTYTVNINNIEYIIVFNSISYLESDNILLIPQFIEPKHSFNGKYLKIKTKQFSIYNTKYTLDYVIYRHKNNNINYLPIFLNINRKYPIFIYLCALMIYLELYESKITQRVVCEFIKRIFKIPKFDHTVLSRLFSDYSKKINIYRYSELDNEQKKIHNAMILTAYGEQFNSEDEKTLSHHYFRRYIILNHLTVNMHNEIIRQLNIAIVELADLRHFIKKNAVPGCAAPRTGVKVDSG
jgi:hypothetical protein